MDADRVVAALETHVLEPGRRIEEQFVQPGLAVFYARRTRYEVRPAEWLVAAEPWVEATLRIVEDLSLEDAPFSTLGLLLTRDGEALFVNDVATMRGLGRRLGDELDPLGYAELLGEFYSGRQIDGPVVASMAASQFLTAGALIRDVDAFAADHPYVDRALVAPPSVRRTDGGVALDFFSYHYFLTDWKGAVDILRWTVTGGGGDEASWSREYIAEWIERP